MLKEVIDNRNKILSTIPGFDPSRIKGLCEQVKEPTTDGAIMVYPGIYKGKDTINFVTSHDFKNGVIWHMKSGATNIAELDGFGRTTLLEYSIPMTLYAINRRDLLQDDAYSPEQMALNILNKLYGTNISALQTLLNLNRVDVKVNSHNTDKDELSTVFINVDMRNVERFDVMYCSINYTITLVGKQECFELFTC